MMDALACAGAWGGLAHARSMQSQPRGWQSPRQHFAQDARDATTLYELLEREVVPSFHDRDAAGVPIGWVRRVKSSLRIAGAGFTTARMMSQYVERVYRTER